MKSELLVDAVRSRQMLSFIYDDKPRVVEPHAVGFNKKEQLVLRAWQIDEGWKLFTVDKAVNIELGASFSEARTGYKLGDKAMLHILAELPEPETLSTV